MSLYLYNTLVRKKQEFIPIDREHVRLYVCGPTVYDLAHIGNARAVVVFDVLYRLLCYLYPRVTYVRNITDVDDKILAAARKNNEDITDLTTRTTEAFHADMQALMTLSPTYEPRVTEHIPHIIDFIRTLLQQGYAYEVEGHVVFEVRKMRDYGYFSRRDRDTMLAGARVEVAPYKRDPMDFILWKPATEKEYSWESPWGLGRPGWHIECSAMAKHYLGTTFDIHGGGEDLIFPHHENERAQSTCIHGGEELARYWVHNGFVTFEKEKMSKSLGNIQTVRGLLEQGWRGEEIRLSLLRTHYRQPLDFTTQALQESRNILNRWYTGLWRACEDVDGDFSLFVRNDVLQVETLLDDLNTPSLIRLIHEQVKLLQTLQGEQRVECYTQVLGLGNLLGLLTCTPEEWLQIPLHQRVEEEEVWRLVEERDYARQRKDYAEADRIRALLQERYDVLVQDYGDKRPTTWRYTTEAIYKKEKDKRTV